ncbi:MAG: multiprotein bridging factor aMBF1 [Promethearchaeota archaeon]
MECEICGKKIIGHPIKITVEGVQVFACQECSSFGERVYEHNERKSHYQKQPRNTQQTSNYNREEKRKHSFNMQSKKDKTLSRREKNALLELLPNYDVIIKKARGKMSQENFAKSLNEKVTLIRKIETKKMKPTIKLARKIENLYHVKLLENEERDDAEDLDWKSKRKDSMTPTLGDFIKRT